MDTIKSNIQEFKNSYYNLYLCTYTLSSNFITKYI